MQKTPLCSSHFPLHNGMLRGQIMASLANSASEPDRDSVPESGVNSALGSAFNSGGESNAGDAQELEELQLKIEKIRTLHYL